MIQNFSHSSFVLISIKTVSDFSSSFLKLSIFNSPKVLFIFDMVLLKLQVVKLLKACNYDINIIRVVFLSVPIYLNQ